MPADKFSVTKGLAMRRSKIHGRGVYARVPIPAGTRIVEYTGERITMDEAEARYPEDPDTVYHTFLFALEDGAVIDAAFRGNVARWINHSCDPNCEAVEEDGRIFIESLRDIAPGEELTLDYGVTYHPDTKRCLCGAPTCRRTLNRLKKGRRG